jgi:hypothetical protein
MSGSNIYVDYNGSAVQTMGGGVNCTFTYTRAHTVYLKCLLTRRPEQRRMLPADPRFRSSARS